MLFSDRREAGRRLAQALGSAGADRPVVLALPRGGVPVGFEVARALHAPLDILIVRKLGAPEHEELAIGAIASGGVLVLNEDAIAALEIGPKDLARVREREAAELARREERYRKGAPPVAVGGRTVILVDDGLATGSSMLAAVRALRVRDPKSIVVAVPVAPAETAEMLRRYADDVVVLATPEPFRGVGCWYGDFAQTTDDEVEALLSDSGNTTGR
jgi:predicted phosphoribosyltransferase